MHSQDCRYRNDSHALMTSSNITNHIKFLIYMTHHSTHFITVPSLFHAILPSDQLFFSSLITDARQLTCSLLSHSNMEDQYHDLLRHQNTAKPLFNCH
jgi:hypothetical protein